VGEHLKKNYAIFAVLVLFFLFPASAFASTIYVDTAADPNEDGSVLHPFDSIQEGIDAAASGDTVQVAAGTYNETITLNKSGITLQGDNKASIIKGGKEFPVIYCENINGDETVVTGFEISGSYHGIQCVGSTNNLRIVDNRIYATGIDILLENVANATIKENLLGGIQLYESRATIEDNRFSNCWDGCIKVFSHSDVRIIKNSIIRMYGWDDAAGINVLDSNAEIWNNSIVECEGGIYAKNSNVSIFNNVFSGNRGTLRAGEGTDMYIENSNLIAKNNIIYESDRLRKEAQSAVYFTGSGTQDFSYNILYNNYTATDTKGIILGPGNIFEDPLFADSYRHNYNLLLESPSIDAGDPNPGFNDLDGSRNDMGIHGGPFPVVPVCAQHSDCEGENWVGETSCSNDDVYQNYRTYLCRNPGSPIASCGHVDKPKPKQYCGNTIREAWSQNYCQGNNVVKTRIVHNKGCEAGDCFSFDTNETQTVKTCTNGCSSNQCNPGPRDKIIWEFDNFVNFYKRYGSRTCDVTGTKPCPEELSWQGNKVKFKFSLDGTEELTDIVKFNFNVFFSNYATDKDAMVAVYAGKRPKKVADDIVIDRLGTFSVEVPSAVFSEGKNYVQIRGKNIRVGYGKNPPNFNIDFASLELFKDYNKPVLACPSQAIDEGYEFFLQENDFEGSRAYLQIGYEPGFAKRTYTQIRVKASTVPVAKKFKTLAKLESKSQSKQLYARIYAKDKLKGTAYSNVCQIGLQ